MADHDGMTEQEMHQELAALRLRAAWAFYELAIASERPELLHAAVAAHDFREPPPPAAETSDRLALNRARFKAARAFFDAAARTQRPELLTAALAAAAEDRTPRTCSR